MLNLESYNQNLFLQEYTLAELHTKFNSYIELDCAKNISGYPGHDKRRILYIIRQIDEVVSLYFNKGTDVAYATMFRFYLQEFINYYSTHSKDPDGIEDISLLFDNFYKIIGSLDRVPLDCKDDLLYMSYFIYTHRDSYDLKKFTYRIISLKNEGVYHELITLFYLQGSLSLYSLIDMNLLHTLDTMRLSSLLNYGVSSLSFDVNDTIGLDIYVDLEWMFVTYLCCKQTDLSEYSDLVFKLLTLLYFIDVYKKRNLSLYNKLENLFDVIAITVYGARYDMVKQIARALNVTHNYLYWREAVIKDVDTISELPEL